MLGHHTAEIITTFNTHCVKPIGRLSILIVTNHFNARNVLQSFVIILTIVNVSANHLIKMFHLAKADGGISVFVDYSHTPDALRKAVSSIKTLTPARTIVVFGCGGDRDASKRSIMGGVALEADYAIVTSDNPRTENPDDIIADIVSGMGAGEGRYEVVPDRHEAIARAIAYANEGDSILIAGKGHENYQIIGSEVRHFDDREVAAEELEKAFA